MPDCFEAGRFLPLATATEKKRPTRIVTCKLVHANEPTINGADKLVNAFVYMTWTLYKNLENFCFVFIQELLLL